MELRELEELMDRFEAGTINKLEYETDTVRVCLQKGMPQPPFAPGMPMAPPPAPMGTAPTPVPDTTKESAKGTAVKAPLVGTFYAASDPEAAPYVTKGQAVKKGDVVGLIEAMKIMNEILAPCDGVVSSISVENGTFVAFDQELLRIEGEA